MQKKYFSKYREPLATLPYLPEIQLESWRWFLADGLKELFRESSPIKDYGGEDLDLEFVDYALDEPKYDEYQAKAQNASFDATLRVKARLTNKKTEEMKEQEIFLADMPLMTPRGTFIVNGVERVIVSQLARSFGLYFTANFSRGKKYFGAKIIPSRGAWIEFESDADGALYARIDRKRKIPASCILRIFGIGTNEEILSKFTKDSEVNPIIKKMLDKDPTKSANEAYMEIYKRLRPGEPATMETAKDLISVMFSEERYDLSSVGRYKLNQRLGLSDNPTSRVLSGNDLVKIISHILTLNSQPNAEADDVDHVGNRRIRSLGELLQQRLRVGMRRMKRTIQDRMSTLDQATLTPAHLINARPFMAILKEFFTTNQLSQFMNQVNVLSELEHLRRLSALGPGGLTRERAGFEVRDVHPSHYGRICPIETPEGPNIGLVVHLAGYARVNEYGILETPYRKVKDGKITDEIRYMTAFEDAKYNIAQAGTNMDKSGVILDDETEGRVKGSPGLMKKEEIDFIEVAPEQAFSIATTLIPFLAHDDANRAMMGSNMQRQAVQCIKPQAPLVGTGVEERAAHDSGRLVLSDIDGAVSKVDAGSITVKSGKGEKKYELVNFVRSNQSTLIHQRPSVNVGDRVKKGDLLADTSLTQKGHLALGQNLLFAFLSWGGANFEDAIILSKRLVQNDAFTSILMEDYSVDVRDTKLGPEITTHDIPNVGEEKLKDLDEDGIVRVGAEVRAGDILVGKISPKGESDLTPEERLLRAIFGEKARGAIFLRA